MLLGDAEDVLGCWSVTWNEAIELAGFGAHGQLVATDWRLVWKIEAGEAPMAVAYECIETVEVSRTTLRLKSLVRLETSDGRTFTLGVGRRNTGPVLRAIEQGREGTALVASQAPQRTADGLGCPACQRTLGGRDAYCDHCAQPLDWSAGADAVASYERSGTGDRYYGPSWPQLVSGFREALGAELAGRLQAVGPLVVEVADDTLDVPDISRDGGSLAVVGVTDHHVIWQPSRARHHIAMLEFDALVAWRRSKGSAGVAYVLTLFRTADSYVRLGAPDFPVASDEHDLVETSMNAIQHALAKHAVEPL